MDASHWVPSEVQFVVTPSTVAYDVFVFMILGMLVVLVSVVASPEDNQYDERVYPPTLLVSA